MAAYTPISVVIITYNEARNIARCIDSVLPIADDIVVVDSFSSDETPAICAQYSSVRWVQHPFAGHIEQKNYALSQARYPHVLSLDADECLDADLQKAIGVVKQQFEHTAYYFNRLNNYCGQWIRHGDWYPDRKLRLWNTQYGSWGGTNPHDRVVLQMGSSTARLQGNLLHYSFSSIEQHVAQINKFSSIGAQQLYQQGKRATWYHCVIKPRIKFWKAYVLRAGFLDGFYGYVIARNSAHAMWLKYVKLRRLGN